MQTLLVSLEGLAARTAANVAIADSRGITAGRAQSLVILAVGLTSVVLGGLSLSRSARRVSGGTHSRLAVVALVVGMVAAVASGVRLANAGPVGTGSGRLGAMVALAVGLVGAVMGWLALARSRRTN